MPTLTKASLATKATYKKCVEDSGVVGATVAKVDHGKIRDVVLNTCLISLLAPSTKLILNGKTPAAFSPALSSRRVKGDIVRQAKAKRYPYGMGITGKDFCTPTRRGSTTTSRRISSIPLADEPY